MGPLLPCNCLSEAEQMHLRGEHFLGYFFYNSGWCDDLYMYLLFKCFFCLLLLFTFIMFCVMSLKSIIFFRSPLYFSGDTYIHRYAKIMVYTYVII